MTYDAREISSDLGSPVELYEFVRGAYRIRLTSADRVIAFGGFDYSRMPMSRSAIESSIEAARAGVTVTVPRTMEVAEWHRSAAPADVITLTIRQTHLNDPDAQFVVVWQGRVVVVEFQGAAALITCESVYTSIRRAGLRRQYSKNCPHALYLGECKVVPGSFSSSGAVTAISGFGVTVSAFGALPAGYLAGGYMEIFRASAQVERRSIASHAGSVATLSQAILGLVVGDIVTAYPGCDHTIGTCASKFANVLNYGGQPYIPIKNPFDGSPVY